MPGAQAPWPGRVAAGLSEGQPEPAFQLGDHRCCDVLPSKAECRCCVLISQYFPCVLLWDAEVRAQAQHAVQCRLIPPLSWLGT